MSGSNGSSPHGQNHSSNGTGPPIPFSNLITPPCQWILFAEINNSNVRVWDLAIFIPNVLFLLYLLWKSCTAIAKLKTTSSPIFTAFYVLVLAVSSISILRCVVSMTVDATSEAGDITDKLLWLVLRFFLLATELSVVIFGLAFGHLDSHTSIRRVLIVTFFIALLYSVTQGSLELKYSHATFTAQSESNLDNDTTTINFNLFAHGGMIFFFVSSLLNFMVYAVIILLPFTRIRERFQLPTKRLFYYYCLALACLNLCQALAALMLYLNYGQSLCAIDVTTFIYFTLFNPLVYGVFLWKFFGTCTTGVHFSYKQQDDDVEDEQLSLPHSNSGSINKLEEPSPIFSYDNTPFDVQFSQSNQSPITSRPAMSVNDEPYASVTS